MNRYTVRFLPSGATGEFNEGTLLLDAASTLGLFVQADCGGSGFCGACKVRIASGVVQGGVSRLTESERHEGWRLACTAKIAGDVEVELPEIAPAVVPHIAVDSDTLVLYTPDRAEGLGIAVDLGTTTVVARLLRLHDGAVLGESQTLNRQAVFGADVISRILAQKKLGAEPLRSKALESIRETIGLLPQEHAEPIRAMTIAGNSVMIRLLTGTDADPLRRGEFDADQEPRNIDAEDLAIDGIGGFDVALAPPVAPYVGGDITAGIMANGIWRDQQMTLYVDLGTNGEIVLGNSEFLLCAAASAGPAFEGGNIGCGMRAEPGAIHRFRMEHGYIMIRTIGHRKPRGVTGSGLIELLAALFENGLVSAGGRFAPERMPERFAATENGMAFVVVDAANAEGNAPILLTEPDVDNLIRAKGAVYAGIATLMEAAGIDRNGIDRVIFAGAFGGAIDLRCASAIGLTPKIPPDRFSYIGNGSLLGAQAATISGAARSDLQQAAAMMTHIELSDDPGYMDRFVKACFLPHTDSEY